MKELSALHNGRAFYELEVALVHAYVLVHLIKLLFAS